MNVENVRLSKFLSLLLRHKPESIDVELDESGWISVDKLLAACAKHGHPITLAQLKTIVGGNDKHRFAFSVDGMMIRASQGHSVRVDLSYERQEPPAVLYHATASRFLVSIRNEGLQKRGRHHVHLSMSPETALTVGRRYGKPVLLQVQAQRMHADGYVFFLSANRVWLTDNVPVDYILFPEEL